LGWDDVVWESHLDLVLVTGGQWTIDATVEGVPHEL
jgi:hypothetical protein